MEEKENYRKGFFCMATIKDIAQKANVSAATVSRILNQDDTLSVTNQTRERVIKIAEELNYTKHLKSNIENPLSIGIFQWYSVFQELEDPYYQAIRVGIEKYCADHNIHVIRTFHSDSNYPEILKGLDGLICIGKFNKKQIDSFQSLNTNTIFVDMKTSKIHCNTIILDFHEAVIEALDYLYGLGHRKIAYLGGKEVLSDNSIYFEERKESFVRYCQEHSIEYRPYLYEEHFSAESGYEMTKKMIAKGNLPTAIFAASDPIAIGAMRALYENNYKIPEDISIVGFDDISVASFSNPPLTTVHTPTEFMGEYAAHYITLQAKDGSLKYQTPIRLTLPCSLIIRNSCCPPKNF